MPLRFGGHRPGLVRDEPRVAAIAVVDAPFGELVVAGTHLSFVPGWNAHQLRRLVRALARHGGPAVLMGDLNMSTAAARRLTRYRPLAAGLTFPADAPSVQIDHLLGRGVPRASGARTYDLPLSDHRALSVDLS